jgi:transposase
MRSNISFDAGSLILINKVDKEFNFFGSVLDGITGKTKHLKESVKAFIYNRLSKCVSLKKINQIYPTECFESLGFKETPKDRTLNRDLERIGMKFQFIIEKYQQLIKKKELVTKEQFIDWSSSYFEGNKAELGALGYSRDKRPGKKQITWGISTGINGIPSSLTIQKGNVNDVSHFNSMLKISKKVLDKESVLIFDCGANSKKNKKKIRDSEYHYLTLRPKKQNTYKKYIGLFKQTEKEIICVDKERYKCIKIKENDEIKYMYYSKKLYKDQIRKRKKQFRKELEKNKSLLKKVKKGKEIKRFVSDEGHIIMKGSLQKTLYEIENSFITGLEGYFILESSIDDNPYKILKLYKKRDIAEKLIRDMKEGSELRPMRHWSRLAIIGYLVIVFLTNCLISLTHYLSKNSVVKNLKLLKKFLNNLTVTFIYPKDGLRYEVLSNVMSETVSILGDSIKQFRDKPPDWTER